MSATAGLSCCLLFQAKEVASKSVTTDAASPAAAVKNGSSTGSGHGESASSSATHTPSQTKKMPAATTSGRDLSKVELVAELNSRLAKLTDTARVSDISVQRSITSKTSAAERPSSSQAPRCTKESSNRAQSVPKMTTKSGERDGTAATKQRNSASATGAPANNNNKNATPTQQTPVSADF